MMKTLLLNPLEKYKTKFLLIIGLVVTILGSLLAYHFQVVYDGTVDVHFGEVTFYNAFLINFLQIAIVSVLLYLAAFLFNRKTRLLDLFIVGLLYRIPIYISVLFVSIPVYKDIMLAVAAGEYEALTTFEVAMLMWVISMLLLLLIWSIVILVNGFKVSANAKKTQHYIYFTLALIATEVVSKILYTQFF